MGEALHDSSSLPAKLLRSFPGELTSSTEPKASGRAAGQVFESGGTDGRALWKKKQAAF